ncbi:MAG: hypothetical protein JSU82_08565 [Rhodospirillales bacterium]|nr:MAG: hypothetical protein JSU82_08565 [Rhodospirillales bacterium]
MDRFDDGYPELGPGPTRLKALTQIVLDRIAEHLQGEAAKHGGMLDAAQLRTAIETFRNNTESDAREFYRTGWNECLSVIDEVRRESSRRMPFERLMVNPVAHLFPAADQPVVPGEGLSRRILPGYLSALYQILGPVLLNQYQSRCRELVRIIQTARGNDFDWSDIYEDPTSTVIVNDILVHLSKHFANFAKRRAWMMGVIVSQMPLGENETERGWVFGDSEFAMLMQALFRSLRVQLAAPTGRERVRDRYGPVVLEILDDFFADLDAATRPSPVRRTAP